jgi:hypothetical protein
MRFVQQQQQPIEFGDVMIMMKRALALAALTAAFVVSTGTVSAQDEGGRRRGGGDFDPAQMRQRMMERYREALEVKGDDEWKVLESRISKVFDAQRDARMGMQFRGQRREGAPQGGGDRGGDRARNNPFGGEPSPEAEALQKALESKASSEEIKAKLAKYRDARKVKEANLEKAQDELRKVLSVRQEATAVAMGLLK